MSAPVAAPRRRRRAATPPAPAVDATYVAELRRLALEAGLDAVGITAAEPWPDVRRRLEERRAAGLHGGMAFTYRNPARSADPTQALPDAAAIVVGARRYRRAAPEGPPPPAGPTGRVAAYAWTEHYRELKNALGVVARRLKADGWRAWVLADDNALVDREAAYRAGVGWFGKNANLLVPGQGSWFVLGGVVTSAPLPAASPEDRVPDGCGSCRRCLDGCPTGAIVAPGVVDARRCLSWLLQVDGELPREYRVAVGDRLYGCDDCQEVCPPNRRTDTAAEAAGGLPPAEPGAVATVALLDLLAADDETLLARHGAWYIPRRDPDHLRRNGLVALGNAAATATAASVATAATAATDTAAGSPAAGPADAAVVATVARYLDHPNPLLRSHAAWAARRLGRDDLLAGRAGDPAVAAELAHPAPPAPPAPPPA